MSNKTTKNLDSAAPTKPSRKIGPIVSSAHLASGRSSELSELEFGLIVASNAFNRWMIHCASAAGIPDMSPLDVLVLHSSNHRSRAKKVSDICMVLNIEDTHTVTYSLKKLLKQELVQSEKRGKETFYSVTDKGAERCKVYSEVRENCLVDSLKTLGFGKDDLGEVAVLLRGISGLYDQAARSAASL